LQGYIFHNTFRSVFTAAGSTLASNSAKAAKTRELCFEDLVDLSAEGVAEGVRRITDGKGVDIVIESIGGTVRSEALSSLALGDDGTRRYHDLRFAGFHPNLR
jgi:NADPH:quinone reductase-like Zn-dependent oxidoreductase